MDRLGHAHQSPLLFAQMLKLISGFEEVDQVLIEQVLRLEHPLRCGSVRGEQSGIWLERFVDQPPLESGLRLLRGEEVLTLGEGRLLPAVVFHHGHGLLLIIAEDISGFVESAAIHHETCLIRRIEAHGLVNRVCYSTAVRKVVIPMLLITIVVLIVEWVVREDVLICCKLLTENIHATDAILQKPKPSTVNRSGWHVPATRQAPRSIVAGRCPVVEVCGGSLPVIGCIMRRVMLCMPLGCLLSLLLLVQLDSRWMLRV